MSEKNFEEWLKQHRGGFHPVVPFQKGDKLLLLDFSESNKDLTAEVVENTNLFISYINSKLQAAAAKYGIGGYDEHRTVYSRSAIFGPSPTASPNAGEIAKAPSRWEGDEDPDSMVEEETIGYRYADPSLYSLLKEFALEHRSNPTQAEDALWRVLKSKQLEGYKFSRQHIIDRYIADFVCLKQKLVIEIDGLIHQLPDNKTSDQERTEALNRLDFEVIRFTNEDVLQHIDLVLSKILSALRKQQEKKSDSDLSSPTGPKDSGLFRRGQGAEPRRLHLGIDIWGKPYTKVMAPWDGIVHSFAFNNAFGDYGATIILTHNLEGQTFHTLYGHLSLNSIKNIQEGDVVRKGDVFCEFGIPFENGQWPPHLHFQLIVDMEGKKGDYPGVCKYSERQRYLDNCPDPDLVLGMMQYADVLI
jgi:very-short-patch-repair endonuclease